MGRYTDRLVEMVTCNSEAFLKVDTPFTLASGERSCYFIDAKAAVATPDNLRLAGEAMVEAAAESGVEFDAVGGLVLGSVPFAFAVALTAGKGWFLVRKEPKGRGTNRWIEGARIGPGTRVMLVDDVVTTGGSIIQAYEHTCESGATTMIATTLVDRGDAAREYFAGKGVAYRPLLTYRDLGIPAVGQEEMPDTTDSARDTL